MGSGSEHLTRGTGAGVPAQSTGGAGHRAAAQMLGLREVVLPAAVVLAAVELLGERLHDPDPVTREAAAAVVARLRTAAGLAQ